MDCKLLCASNVAYSFNSDGKFATPTPGTPAYPFYQQLNVIKPIIPFSKGLQHTNAAILAETSSELILAFRGTLPPDIHSCASWIDWLKDIILIPAIPDPNGVLPGHLYEATLLAYYSLKEEVFQTLYDIYNSGNQKPLYITGHSKGGPMASYASYQARLDRFPLVGTVTFASPHPGDQVFAEEYQKVALLPTRYENDLDLVPFLPPTPFEADSMIGILDLLILLAHRINPTITHILEDFKTAIQSAASWNYAPLGTLKFITSTHQVVPYSSKLWLHRLEDFLINFQENGFEQGFWNIADAHTIACGGGYQKGVCPNVCSSSNG